MSVIRRKICADLEIADNRHIDKETEHSGTHEIPEAHSHEEIENPFVLPAHFRRTAVAGYSVKAPSFKAQQNQRHDLQCGET